MPLSTNWEVVGGGDKGGILVREGQDLKSPQCDDRLSTGAIIEELELIGERLHFKVISGTGPQEGWVSLKVAGKAIVEAKAKDYGGPGDSAGPVEVNEELKTKVAAQAEELKKKDMLNQSAFKYKVLGGPLEAPKFRIICFHNAGGAESIYSAPATVVAKWIKANKAVEMIAIDYPGRDKLKDDKFFSDTKELAQWCLAVCYDKLDLPYVVWGHSVGTWVAFEFLMLARQIGLPMPKAAFLNAFVAPHWPVEKRPWKRSKGQKAEAVKEILKSWDPVHTGGAGKVVFDEPEWTKTWEPMMRADFQLYDEYEFTHAGAPKFEFPIHNWQMENAKNETPEMGQMWKEWTTGEFDHQIMKDAGHLTAFYMADYKKAYFEKMLPLLKQYSGVE